MVRPTYEELEQRLATSEISEQTLAEKARDREQDLLSSVMNSTDIMLVLLDLEFTFVWVNQAYAQTCGMKPEEMVGKNHFALYPHAENEAIFRKVRDTGESVFYKDKPFTFPDQPERGVTYWDWSLAPARVANGDVTGLVFSLRETTQSKNAEMALRESEQGLSLALSAGRFATWDWQLPNGRARWNDESYRMMGYAVGEVEPSYEAWAARVHPEDRPTVEAAFRESLVPGGNYVTEFRTLWPDGTVRWLEARGRVERDAAGNSVRSYGVMAEITDRKQAEESLRESEGRLRTVLENSPDAIFLKDRESRLLLANPATFAIIGKPAEACLGKTDDQFYDDPADGLAIMANDRRIMASGEVDVVEETVNTASGPRHYLSTKAPYRDAAGTVVGLIGIARDITARKGIEEALRQSEQRFRLALENSPVLVAIQDADLVYQWAYNTRTRRPEDVVGKTDADLFAAEDLPSILEAKRRVLQTGEVVRLAQWATSSGQRVFLDCSYEPVRDSAGHITGVGIAAVNLTEQKRAEEALERARHTLAEAQKIAHLGSFEYVAATRTTEWSEEEYRIYGLDPSGPSPAYNEMLAGCIHPDDSALLHETFTKAILSRAIYALEHRIVRPDGSVRWVYDRAHPYLDARGDIERYVGATLDITDRKQAEDALRHLNATLEIKVAERTAEVVAASQRVQGERQRLYGVLETLPVYVVLLSNDFRVPFANRFFEARFGKSEGRRCYEYLFSRTEPCEICESFEPLRTGQPHHWYRTGPDGRDYDVYDYPFTDSDGSQRVMEMGVDITEARRAQAALHQANEQLAARATQLRALAGELTLSEQRERRRMAKVLHDHLQQLLVGAKFRAAILGRAGDELVKAGVAEIERLLDESILASRSLTAELSPPILHEAGLNAGLEWLARWMGDRHGLFVDLAMEKDSAALAEDVKVLLFESVRELLFNCVKHSRTRSATLNLRRVDGQLQIVVADQGAGFDPAATRPAGSQGGGFGLFSIRERLDLVGGRLEIDSAPGKGSRFVVTAPVGLAPAVEPIPPVVSESSSDGLAAQVTAPQTGTKIRVLLADDHVVMREGLARLLGHEPDIEIVGQAADGEEAVRLAGKLLPDVILMDGSMPKLNGVEATRAIHNDYPEIQIVGLSMFDESERAQAMRDAGAANYLAKSGPPDQLIDAIRQCMRGHVSDAGPTRKSRRDAKAKTKGRSTR